MMNNHREEQGSREGNPEKAYNNELAGKGNAFTDTPSEADARDRAKMEKSLAGETQKIDGIHPDELGDDDMDEMTRETLENK